MPDSSLIQKDALPKKGNVPHQRLVPAVPVRCSSTGELCIYMRVLPLFLPGHAQEHPELPLGLVALVVAWLGGARVVCSGVGRVP